MSWRLGLGIRIILSPSFGFALVAVQPKTRAQRKSFSIDKERNWQGIFYVEAYDHYGLDDGDPQKYLDSFGLFEFQNLGSGFATWWILQHIRDYKPFITKLKFVVCLKGKL